MEWQIIDGTSGEVIGNMPAAPITPPHCPNSLARAPRKRRETTRTIVDEILNHLVNLTTPHESEARETLPAGITLARAINYGGVERVSREGKRGLIRTRDALAQWRAHQYDMSPREAGNYALRGDWPNEI